MKFFILCILVLIIPKAYTAFDTHKFVDQDSSSFLSVHEHDDGHKCIHGEIVAQAEKLGILPEIVQIDAPVTLDPMPYQNTKRSLNQASTAGPEHLPLRVHIATELLEDDKYTCYQPGQSVTVAVGSATSSYVCTAADVLTDDKKNYLLNTLLSASVNWLSSALAVVRSQSNLRMSYPTCSNGAALSVPVDAKYNNPGVDADFILFVTSRPILTGGTLAFASSCAINNLGRPIAGYANFNTSNLVGTRGDFPRKMGVAVHEISHALGFSPSYWKSGSFIQYTTVDVTGKWQYQQIPASLTYSTIDNGNGYTFTRIITPEVRATVQQHFNCSNLLGGDLEDGGAAGTTAGSHWEKRVFMNEYMTGSELNYPVLSNVTLSLFRDTGWYRVNYSVADFLVWGRGWGCRFFEDCSTWKTNFGSTVLGLCDAPSSDVVCTYDRRAYGICNIIDNLATAIPTWFQHWKGQPTKGGQNPLADYCGYVGQQGAATFCNVGGDDVEQLGDELNVFGISATGEQFEASSRCMMSTLNKINSAVELESFTAVIIPSPRSARCYNQTCVSASDLRVQVDDVWYKCPVEGGDIANGGTAIFGFGGSLECPPASELCNGAPTDTTWPEIFSIEPNKGRPSTQITIKGSNFNINMTYVVVMEVACSDVTVVNSTTITATIPGGDHFVSVADLEVFQTKKNLYVKDARGYTANLAKSFTIQVPFDGDYIRNLFNWMGANPLWAFIVWACILIPIFCCCFCCYKCLRRPKKPKRGAHHADTKPEEYYEDDYDLDDYYASPKDDAKYVPPPVPAKHHADAGYNMDDEHVSQLP